ncbi:MAG: ATP-binding protein [Bacteroidales bacterium]|nr:ATP-binding protein [Bacteroidales bacterium]
MTKPRILILKNSESELNRLAEFIEGLAEEWSLNPEIILNINLAIEEAFVNVINYAYSDQSEHELFIRIHREMNAILIEIEDDGIPFNPLEGIEPDMNLPIEDRTVGGLGIFLIKQLMTEVKYKRNLEKNTLLLRKEL